MAKTRKAAKRGPRLSKFILNCVESKDTDDDWTFGDAVDATFLKINKKIPKQVDLRKPWWTIRDQGSTGACVGFATADGLLRWLYVKEQMMEEDELTSPRFIWMANKETDNLTSYPTSFLDSAGTSTKLALKVAKKYGCVLETMLPMKGRLSTMHPHSFFSISSQYRITAYYNLLEKESDKINTLKRWIAGHGPVLTRLDIDPNFKFAHKTNGILQQYDAANTGGGHAICLVGYTEDHFIVRNSWGEKWGDNGFAYASYDYAKAAFTEAYGAVLNRLKLVPATIR
jgi:C1A family cysteine protease